MLCNVKHYIKQLFTYNTMILSFMFAGLLYVVDYYNRISKIIENVPNNIKCVVGIIAFSVFIISLFKYKLYDIFKAKIIGAVDKAIFVLLESCVIYTILYKALLNDHLYKLVISIVLIAVLIVVICKRASIVFESVGNTKNTLSVKLEDVYKNRIPHKELPIIISEEVDTNDLLGRTFVVNNLLNTIQFREKNTSCTIGLVGQWGSGKTTVLEIAKKKLKENPNYLVIDNFEPWLYESQVQLLTSAYEAILNILGIRYSINKIQRTINALYNAASSLNPVYGFVCSLLYRPSKEVISSLKNKIRDTLYSENKSIVFVMDNFDRTESKNIISIFKFIGVMLDCPGITYLLSYDKKKLNSLFEKQEEFEERYYEKIINHEIHIPEISSEMRNNLTDNCLCNLLMAYDSNVNVVEYGELIKFLVAHNIDIRQLKQYFNTVFPLTYMEETHLNKKDLLTLLTIQFFSIELYTEIFQNRKNFISVDLYANDVTYNISTSNNRQDIIKGYYEILSEKYPSYLNLITSIFPVFGIFGTQDKMSRSSEEYIDITTNCRICSGKYIDLYFSYASNEYLSIKKIVEGYIAQINTISDLNKLTYSTISELPKKQHKEFAEQLEVYINKMETEYYADLAISLFENVHMFDDSVYFAVLNSKDRVIHIIEVLLTKCDKKGFEQFLNYAPHKYSHLSILCKIYCGMKVPNIDTSEVAKRKQQVFCLCNGLIKEIVEKAIDLYDDDYYYPNSIFYVFSENFALTDTEKELYKNVIIKPKNIYKLLWDCTEKNIGTGGYAYRISKDKFDKLFCDTDLADELVDKHPPQSDDEQEISKFYYNYKNTSENTSEHSFPNAGDTCVETEFQPIL